MPHRGHGRYDNGGPVPSNLLESDNPLIRKTARKAQKRVQHSARRKVGRERARALESGRETRERAVADLQEFDPREFLGEDALSRLFTQATETNFQPQLRSLQARNARRGVRGPLAGALEGDLASSFRRDLLAQTAQAGGQMANMTMGRAGRLAEIGGAELAQGRSLLGTELELELARQQARRQRRSGLAGTIGAGLGAVAGSFIPGIGTAAGMAAGSAVGGGVGRTLFS